MNIYHICIQEAGLLHLRGQPARREHSGPRGVHSEQSREGVALWGRRHLQRLFVMPQGGTADNQPGVSIQAGGEHGMRGWRTSIRISEFEFLGNPIRT